MNKTLAALLNVIVISISTGCMMPPVQPEVPLLGPDLSVQSSSSHDVKLVFVNTTNKLLWGADGTSRINVKIDGKAIAGPNIGEYVQVQVPKGKHTVEVWHLDVVKFRSEREIDLQQDVVIELKATPFSNRILVQSTMPGGDFRPMDVAAFDPEKKNAFQRSTAAVGSYMRSLR